LNRTLTPHSIIHGDACFAYFNKIWGIPEGRMPTALQAYEALLEKQSGPYRAHLNWIKDDERGGEIVRVSMIECRSTAMTTSTKFSEAVARNRLSVRGKNQQVTDTVGQ
jgi:hypothetical protein